MGWERADRIKNVFVKGQRFDLPSLLGSDTLAERYAAGAVVLSRLCPTDYHRFHFPVSGVPGPWTKLGGPLASVSPYCLRGRLAWLWTNKSEFDPDPVRVVGRGRHAGGGSYRSWVD